MQYVSHPLIKEASLELRSYQEAILNTAKKSNTLVVLPTGTGKTPLAILLTAYRLHDFPDSQVLVLAPTKPLAEQHERSFKKFLTIEDFVLLTGTMSAEKRKPLYNKRVIFATPQTIENDIKNGTANLSNFSLLVVDEAHHSVGNYAYTFVAKAYAEQSTNPLILALTASPGSSEEKIKKICEALFITDIEIRSETDEDVKEYVKPVEIEIVKVEMPDHLKRAQELMKSALKERIRKLRKYYVHVYTKKDLLDAQKSAAAKARKNPVFFRVISLIAEAVKVWHALELLETQSIASVRKYFAKLEKDRSKSAANALSALEAVRDLLRGEHPKLKRLAEIVKRENGKIIVFSHYRDTIEEIVEALKKIEGCRPVALIGQSGENGLKQKEQIDIISRYESGEYNCLVASPIGEEGLHLSTADVAIFYDSVASEIRAIQRRGRVGRVKIGKIIFLLTRGTRDEANYWVSKRKERKMKQILREMKQEIKEKKKQKSLTDFGSKNQG